MENEQGFGRNMRTEIGKTSKKRWLKPLLIFVGVIVVIAGVVAWKTGATLNKISVDGNIFGSLTHMIPGVKDSLEGEENGRVNVLLLGMRGEHVTGGGTLADTIMVASFDIQNNKVSMLSIPRDLYVTDPGTESKSKINAVYAYGEEKGNGKGIEDMKTVVSDIVGMPVSYALVINFKGFTDLVNAIGGVEVNLTAPFEEALQFNEEHVCDSEVFTVPTGKFEDKTVRTASGRLRVVKQYPLCTNPNTECGGDFKLPAGKQTLNGDQALCYARARKTTSDFDRAKRQQLIIQKIKEKALSAGTLTDFSKINAMIDSLGENVKTDMQGWELKRLYELERAMQNQQVVRRVLENSDEGLLYNPPMTPETGYILLPIGDNYDRIREMFKNIFTLPVQSDIEPKA
ncbi:MAG: cell envelope-related function transcriptional attenuator, LytR/CpsA family protein, nonfunctional [Candidatus Moranbacteria bacterium GW2011_GWD2_36_12]|nr:MAG: cell envelope-related function transcriptional attenuator, LytR/CpsA family protein, nonfunctional [Candidatus Moranbacteria bacterium GW2011_GWD2_36_12]KKQ04683.1 MAG: cell envelope-related function transcriptional attenuator, LytR/CpsA family protein, nonfunctional [Candidatus Moranbacteria bacterium GW2011_GWE2_36_40]